jgi:hypothetical protein
MKIGKGIAVIAALTLPTTVATAASAPKEVYGKSISLSWSESRQQKTESDQQMRNIGVSVQMNIYVSTAGRPFVRVTQSGTGGHSRHENGGVRVSGGSQSETAPGDSTSGGHATFEGRSLVVYKGFESGARRVVVNFDSSGTGCNATAINGKEAGKNMVRNTVGHGRVEVFSTQVGAVTCSIQAGNVFGQ